jgi:PhnB protein
MLMKNVDFYLHFNGNCEKAMNFYKSIFGGDFVSVQRYGDVPGSEKMSDEDRGKMIHMSLKLSEHSTLMGSDVVTKMVDSVSQGNNYHICLQVSNDREADKVFAALSGNGVIEMPMNKTFWGAYFGMCIDKFGVQWMINYAEAK